MRSRCLWLGLMLVGSSWPVQSEGQEFDPEQFINFVTVSAFADGDYWFLVDDLEYEVGDTGVIVPVPAGFVTDFASIPRPFWSFLPRWGKYGAPAVVHDYLYWDQRCSREEADGLMRVAMRENEVGAFREEIIHAALRMGGFFAWRSNASRREEDLVRTMPQGKWAKDPTTRWKDYQQKLRDGGAKPEPRPAPGPKPEYCKLGVAE